LEGEPRASAEKLLLRERECLDIITRLADMPPPAAKTRHHGDFHLGQVLLERDDFILVDFEGEPARTLEERRIKKTPMRDVAGMIRSFDYASWVAVKTLARENPGARDDLAEHARAWRELAVGAFRSAYVDAMAGCVSYPADPKLAERLLDLLLLEKALYEVAYETSNRPAWLTIPISGVIALLNEAQDTLDAPHT
jgi:maltose alpha-D-glucosyltransferase/alpha-amylase